MASNDIPSIPAMKPINRLSSTTKNETGVAKTVPAKREKKFVFLSFNARSLFNKIGELELLIKTHSPLFISIQETWCIPYEPNSFYNISGYSLYRRDRNVRSGGGVCIYINDNAVSQADRKTELESPLLEDIWIQIHTKSDQRSYLVGTIYRPPGPIEPFFTTELEKCLSRARNYKAELILLGDFNAHCQAWWYGDQTDEAGGMLHDLFSTFNITQKVHFPTCVYAGQLKSCLDLVATNAHPLFVTSLPPLGSSDHLTLLGELPNISDEPSKMAEQKLIFCWSKVDIENLKNKIRAADWTNVLGSSDIGEAWAFWKTKLLSIVQTTVPTKCVQHASRPRPWMTTEVSKEVKIKHNLFRKYKSRPSQSTWQAFQKQRNVVTALVRRAKSAFVHGIQQQSTAAAELGEDRAPNLDHPPRLHRLIRCFTSGKSNGIPDLINEANVTLTRNDEKADLLNRFFIKQAQESSAAGTPPDVTTQSADPDHHLEKFAVTQLDVNNILRSLDPSKAAGGDGIPTKLLRIAADEITPCVFHLFQLSLSTSTVPTEWKQATVTPIYKNRGSRQQPGNYRPISLLTVLAKALERLVHKQLYRHLQNFLPLNQSGFRPKDNTSFQLARIVHQLSQGMDQRKNILTCYYDLSKAFDRVWHQGLIKKLHHLGVRDVALAWIQNYLSDRYQRVRVNNSFSSWAHVPAGVPQGSVLGPLLFIAYTSDLPAAVPSPDTRCAQFADDTALTTFSETLSTAEHDLQDSVTSTAQWLSDWRLQANTEKTVVMQTTRATLPIPIDIELGGVRLQTVRKHRHLGLVFTSDLRWNAHIDHVLSKSSRLLGLLFRLRSILSQHALSIIYKIFIRPVLEYASIAWSDLTNYQSARLERFQRRAAKIILRLPLFQPSNHDEILSKIGWDSLQSRRTLALATLGYQMAHGKIPEHLLHQRFPKRNHPYALRHQDHFETPLTRTQVFGQSPLFQACTIFNQLPKILQQAKTLAQFRQGARKELLSKLCPCAQHIRRTSQN